MSLRRKDEELLAPVITKDESPQIAGLFANLAILVVCLVLGLFLIYYAYGQLWINWPASSRPVDVKLLSLEKGEELPNHHIKLDEHISMRQDPVGDTYAIFSTAGTTVEDHIDSTPGTEFDSNLEQLKYRMRKVRVLIRDKTGMRKSGIFFEKGVEGLIVGKATGLEIDKSVFARLNIKNPENVYVLEVGRKPNVLPGIIMAIAAVVFLAVAGYFVFPLFKTLRKFGYD